MFETQRQIEVISIITCVTAASIGPVLLIGAHFSMNLPIAGLMFSFLSAIIFRLLGLFEKRIIVPRFNDQQKALIGILVGAVPFVTVLSYAFTGDFRSLFFISWNEGLASVPILFGCVLLLLFLVLIIDRKLYPAIYQVSYHYALPMTTILLILPGIPSSEGKVLLINVGVVYAITYIILSRIKNKSFKF